jgi:hypothetical protein
MEPLQLGKALGRFLAALHGFPALYDRTREAVAMELGLRTIAARGFADRDIGSRRWIQPEQF